MSENRGRPTEKPAIPWQKYTQETIEVPSKPELGGRSVWHYDRSKFENGPWRTEHFEAKGYKNPKPKIDQKMYGKQPTVMVFKTSNRSNAKTKIKVFNKNIDYIISAKKLPGVPENAVILDLAVGRSYIDKYKDKYNV